MNPTRWLFASKACLTRSAPEPVLGAVVSFRGVAIDKVYQRDGYVEVVLVPLELDIGPSAGPAPPP